MQKDMFKEKINMLVFVIGLWMLMLRQMAAMMPIVPKFSNIAYVYGDKVLWLGIAVLGFLIIANKPTIIDIIACAWSIVAFQISDNAVLMILTFLLFALYKSDIDRNFAVKAWMVPVTFLMIVVLPLYPILHMQGNPIAEDYGGIRWNYFFGHPNGFGLWFTFWIFGMIYLGYKRLSCWMVSLILLGVAVFLAVVPGNKTAALVLLLGIPILLLERYSWKLCRLILYVIPIVSILTTVVLTLLYYYGVLLCDQYVFHPTFSMRFQDAAINLQQCPLNLLGQKVLHLGESIAIHGVIRHDVSMDNGIVAVLIYYGIIVGILLIGFFVKSIFKLLSAADEKDRIKVILLVLTFVFGMMEWLAWYGTIGFSMFFLGEWIRKDDKKKSELA